MVVAKMKSDALYPVWEQVNGDTAREERLDGGAC